MNCNNTIPATLDLTQSLKSFEKTLMAEMSLSEVSDWDGRTICEREQKIRQAALILAGQCKRLVVTQAVRVEGSTYNGNKTNTGMAASKKQGKWASRTASAMFG